MVNQLLASQSMQLEYPITHQLGCTCFEEDGQDIPYSIHTVHKGEQNNIIVLEGRSRGSEEIEHCQVKNRFDHGAEVVNCVLCKEVCKGAYPRSTLPPVL